MNTTMNTITWDEAEEMIKNKYGVEFWEKVRTEPDQEIEEVLRHILKERREDLATEQGLKDEEKRLLEMFPDLEHFVVCLDLDTIDKPITQKKKVTVRVDYNCYCYNPASRPRKPSKFVVKGESITPKLIIQELIRRKWRPCNHIFLESISVKDDGYAHLFCGS